MPLKFSGIMFGAAGIIFTVTGFISDGAAYYGLSFICVGAALLCISGGFNTKGKRGKRQRRKGKFQA